jgi:membrane protease YdiL (CAAX protease family)
LPIPAVAAFLALTVALLTLWAPRAFASPGAVRWWAWPLAAALVFAVVGELVDARGLLGLLLVATACRAANDARHAGVRGLAYVAMLTGAAALLLHILPGFDNPLVLDHVVLSPDSVPYTKYLNFDKGVLGLFLLGLYAPARGARGDPLPGRRAFLWRFAVVAVVTMTLAVVIGYARWDPKLPAWWPIWLWSMVFLTALPEEAVFRHVLQGGLHGWLGESGRGRAGAVFAAGILFGLAHAGAGWAAVALATAAGAGYGWIYAATRSIGASVLAHAGLNLLHLVCFTYPALQAVR